MIAGFRRLPLLVLAVPLLLATGCGNAEGAPSGAWARDPAGRSYYLDARAKAAGSTFVTRIDGDVEDSSTIRLWDDEDQTVVVTGYSPGTDQHKILIFSPEGRRITEWRPSDDNPYDFVQYQHPAPASVRHLDIGDRRFLAHISFGIFFPSAVELVELGGGVDRRLRERLVVWNPGVINQYAVEGDLLAIVGLNNKMQVTNGEVEPRAQGSHYSMAVGLVDLKDLPTGEQVVARRVVLPTSPRAKGAGYRFYYLLPVVDSAWESQGPAIQFSKGRLRAAFASGLSFSVDGATGRFEFECSDAYRSLYQARRKEGAPPIDEFLRGLGGSVRTWEGVSR